MCFSDRQPGDWGPRRVTEGEMRAAFGAGWRIDSLVPTASTSYLARPPTAEAWLADVIRLARHNGHLPFATL